MRSPQRSWTHTAAIAGARDQPVRVPGRCHAARSRFRVHWPTRLGFPAVARSHIRYRGTNRCDRLHTNHFARETPSLGSAAPSGLPPRIVRRKIPAPEIATHRLEPLTDLTFTFRFCVATHGLE